MIRSAKLLLTTVLLLVVAPAFAAPKLKERYQEYLVCSSSSCFEHHKGSFQISWQSDTLPAGFFSSINASTEFRCRLGNFTVQVPINHDPDYQPGDTNATIEYTTPLLKGRKYLIVNLDWAKDQLKVHIKGLLPELASPVAQSRAGVDLYPIEVDSEIQLINSGTAFYSGGFGGFRYPSKTKRTTRTAHGTTYELDKIKVTGPE